MDTLRFAHQFFHFCQKTKLSLWGESAPKESQLADLFRENPLPRRALKAGNRLTYREALAEYARIESWGERIGLRVLGQKDFPAALLAHIPPERLPPLLYLRGKEPPPEEECVAVVGTRYPSELGREAGANFSAFFGIQGLKIVSGLAKGVDFIAHQQNLRLGTIAVLGGGVDDIYPVENGPLACDILAKGGSLLSPFPLSQVPLPCNFPQRNEWIAALAAGTVVIEGNETSGAAVTGKQSLAMGKCVVALAQDFRTGFGRGAISLQQAGAVLVCSEIEALQSIFARFGGFSKSPLHEQGPKGRSFTFREFLDASNKEIGTALALLEEGVASGRIEKTAPDRYRIRRKPRPDARR
jgi:DNA protecting protein DprA